MPFLRAVLRKFGYVKVDEVELVETQDGRLKPKATILPHYSFMFEEGQRCAEGSGKFSGPPTPTPTTYVTPLVPMPAPLLRQTPAPRVGPAAYPVAGSAPWQEQEHRYASSSPEGQDSRFHSVHHHPQFPGHPQPLPHPATSSVQPDRTMRPSHPPPPPRRPIARSESPLPESPSLPPYGLDYSDGETECMKSFDLGKDSSS